MQEEEHRRKPQEPVGDLPEDDAAEVGPSVPEDREPLREAAPEIPDLLGEPEHDHEHDHETDRNRLEERDRIVNDPAEVERRPEHILARQVAVRRGPDHERARDEEVEEGEHDERGGDRRRTCCPARCAWRGPRARRRRRGPG